MNNPFSGHQTFSNHASNYHNVRNYSLQPLNLIQEIQKQERNEAIRKPSIYLTQVNALELVYICT